LAARHPELVARLALVDILCHQPSGDLRRRAVLLPLLGGLIVKQLLGRTMFHSFFRDAMLSSEASVPSSRLDHYYDMLNTPAARGSALATIRATGDTRPVVAQVARVQSETLVVWGRADRVYPAGLGHRLAREIPGAGFELLDAGHCPQEECPDRLASLLRRFLRAERPSLL
jgi:pimeloyl-ACP methyl ester carboxylesterase